MYIFTMPIISLLKVVVVLWVNIITKIFDIISDSRVYLHQADNTLTKVVVVLWVNIITKIFEFISDLYGYLLQPYNTLTKVVVVRCILDIIY